MAQDSSAIVTAFVKLWDQPAPDAAELGAFFADDAVYHNIPMKPVNGRAAIEKVLSGMGAGGMKSKGWEIKHQVASGDVVMNERVDRFENAGKEMSIPVVGVFVVRNGKIAEWRDYFDMGMFQEQMK